MKQKNYKRGISLIVLVITIIIMIIIAATIILSLNGSGIVQKGTSAVLRSDMKNMQMEYNNYVSNKTLDSLGNFRVETLNANDTSLTYSGQPEGEIGNIYDIIPSATEKYGGKVSIINGKLYYEYETEEEMNTINEMGGVSSVIKQDMLDIQDGVLMGFKEGVSNEMMAGTLLIPSTVTSIYVNEDECTSFFENDKIKGVIIEEGGLTEIPENAFIRCYSIENVVIPESVETIGGYAFLECNNLKEVDIQWTNTTNTTYTIGTMAFSSCSELKTLNLENVNTIGNMAFSLTGLESVTIKGNGATQMGTDDTYGYGVFYNCTNLKTVYIENVAYICNQAFQNSSVETVTIKGNGITRVGLNYGVFSGCANLKTVYIENVATICDMAFYGTGVERVTIKGNGSTYIGNDENGGYGVFANCANLKTAYIENVAYICNQAFQYSGLETVTVKGNGNTIVGSNYGVFANCPNLRTANIENVDSLCYMAFYACPNLKQVLLEGVRILGGHVFHDCPNLEKAIIPISTKHIGEMIFYGCDKITTIQMRASSLDGITLEDYWNCTVLNGNTLIEKAVAFGYTGN